MDYGKLSPALALALDDFEANGRPVLAEHNRTMGIVSVDPTLKEPRVVVFVHCDEGLAANAFADLGVQLNSATGSLRTGIVPLAALDRLTDDPAVRRIEPSARLVPLMDVAVPAVGVPALWDTGLTGKNVVIGVVDTGVDTTNTSFKGRILRIWDQELPGPGVPEGAYGIELKGRQMSTSQDTRAHGTHVSGIALSADPTYRGVAPAAKLLTVKTDMMTAHIADGIRYIFRVAEEMGLPAVVNLSLGGHGDPHDGTDSLSAIIDTETGPGRIVCCAAGNEGNDNIHAQGKVRRGGVRTFSSVVFPAPAGRQPAVATFNGWYSGTDAMAVAVVSPDRSQTPFQDIITSGSPSRNYELPFGSVRIVTPGPDPGNGDVNFFVQILPAASPPATGTTSNPHLWKIRMKGRKVSNGLVDVWSVDLGAAQFTGRTVKDFMKVGAPAAATQAVTVGSYTTKVEWEDFFGDPHQAGMELNDISDFSSEGPRRDGVPKPDVIAPGAIIVSAMSVHAPTPRSVIVDDMNRAMAGTSMACPFISGVVALLLERDPGLDPSGVKELLRKNSKIPRKSSGTFDLKWGYGLIKASGL